VQAKVEVWRTRAPERLGACARGLEQEWRAGARTGASGGGLGADSGAARAAHAGPAGDGRWSASSGGGLHSGGCRSW
jgi:hypothetical protein